MKRPDLYFLLLIVIIATLCLLLYWQPADPPQPTATAIPPTATATRAEPTATPTVAHTEPPVVPETSTSTPTARPTATDAPTLTPVQPTATRNPCWVTCEGEVRCYPRVRWSACR